MEYEAGRRGKEVDPEALIEPYTLELDPLPCWRRLPKEEIRRRIAEMVDEIDAEHARRITPTVISSVQAELPVHMRRVSDALTTATGAGLPA